MLSKYRRLSLLPLAGVALTAGMACAQAPSPQLNAVLAQMDASSARFQSATADFQWTFVEHFGSMSDTTKQAGSMYIERGKAGVLFGADVFDLNANGSPQATPAKVINFDGNDLRVYTPSEKQEDLFKTGANRANAESYFSLGFGGSGKELAQGWQITDRGPATLQEDGHPVRTEQLVLVSKDPAVRNNIKQVTLWIDPSRDISLKQVFQLPSGDERTATYSNIRLNGKVNRKPFDIPTKGVTVVPH